MLHALVTGEAEVLTLHLLGGFRAAVGARVIQDTDWKRRKARTLVKVLALAHDHRLHREQVMDLLWPTLLPAAAVNNFYQTLHAARRVLTSSSELVARYLNFHTETLSLCPDTPLWVDVSAFETAAAQARSTQAVATYTAALDLYSGDLLPEDVYADWTRDRRHSLRQTYLTLLLDLSKLYERARFRFY